MSIHYNMDPISSLELFYDGEHHGVYKGDFIKNEKKRGLVLPPMLHEFLERFGYLSVNAGGLHAYRIFHPDDMAMIALSDGNGGEVKIIVIGSLRVIKQGTENEEEAFLVGVRPDTPDFQMAMGQEGENGGMDWWPTGRTLFGFFNMMFLSILGKSCSSYIFEEPSDIKAVLKHHKFDVSQAQFTGDWATVHFNDESGEFIITEFDEESGSIKCVRVAALGSGGEEEAEKLTALSLDELEEVFAAEFYGNALHCDFERCLAIQTEIITRLEAAGTDEKEILGHYRLSGRCLAELKRIDEADAQYAKMMEIAERHGSEDPKELADAYSTLGNYYFDIGRVEESDRLFDKELSLRKESAPDDCYNIGMIYADRAKRMEGDDSRLERIIELCELALEEFQKDPRDSGCKYETARMQQIRGNARRRKKELDKLK